MAEERIHKAQVKRLNQLGRPVTSDQDKYTISGNFLVIKWNEDFCQKTGDPCLPRGTKHNCQWYKNESENSIEKEWWE